MTMAPDTAEQQLQLPTQQHASTQPEDVLRRATELLNGQAIQIDVAAFTQRILTSVEGQSQQELTALAQRYAEATHLPPGTETDQNAVQELALTAAILEGRIQELTPSTQPVEAATEQLTLTPPEPLEQLQPIVTEEDEQLDPIEATTEATPEAVTEEVDQQTDTAEQEKMQQLRAEILSETFSLEPTATAEQVQNAAGSLSTPENAQQIETALAELASIEARLGNTTAVAVLSEAPTKTATVETAAVAEKTPVQEAPAVEPQEQPEPVVEVAEKPKEATAPSPEQPETSHTTNESSIKIDHAISAITDDISALEKTLQRYEERERDLHEQVGTIERHLPHFMLSGDRLRMVKALNAIQIAVAHTRESLESLRANMVAVQNANEEFDVIFDEIVESDNSTT